MIRHVNRGLDAAEPIAPRHQVTETLGPDQRAALKLVLSSSDRMMAVFPDGTLYIGHGEYSLRIIAADGRTIWRSVETIENDESEAERLAERRKPKRIARDLDE